MNDIKPSIGIEFTDDYNEAKRKILDCVATVSKLSPMQQEYLAKECAAILGTSAALQQFIDFMNGRRY